MKRRWQNIVVPCVLCASLLASAFALQNHQIYLRRQEYDRFRDMLYLPSSRYVKAVALGYDHFVSDFLWLRMIQSFAAGWSKPEHAVQMKKYFDVITDLDPKFIKVYSFAIMAIGEEGKRDDLTMQTVDKAIIKNPSRFEIAHEGAFYAFYKMKRADLAKYYIRLAQKDPNAPQFLDRWEPFFDLNLGRYRVAYEKYFADYLKATLKGSGNKVVINIYRKQLNRANNQWIIEEIRQRVKEWHETHGVYPTIAALNEAGAFEGVFLPNVDYIRAQIERAEAGRMPSIDDPGVLANLIDKGLSEWHFLPKGPHEVIAPQFPGYIIWPGLDIDHDRFILSTLEALHTMQAVVRALNQRVDEYRQAHDGHNPPDLETVAAKIIKVPDAFGGQWTYDPQLGEADCASVPLIVQRDLPRYN